MCDLRIVIEGCYPTDLAVEASKLGGDRTWLFRALGTDLRKHLGVGTPTVQVASSTSDFIGRAKSESTK